MLAQLRDIHTPPPVSWWPPAPGWWALGLLALLTILWGVTTAVRRYRRGRYRRAGRALLKELWENYARDGDSAQFARELVAIMRRCAIAANAQQITGHLATETLLAALQAQGNTQLLNVISLQEFSAVLYDPDATPLAKNQAQALYDCALDWLSKGASLPC